MKQVPETVADEEESDISIGSGSDEPAKSSTVPED